MWFWLFLFLPKINYATENQNCTNISCDHNNVNVCGVYTSGSNEVSFRLFQDKCALQRFECETGMKGYKSINVKFCNQALSLDTKRNSNLAQYTASTEDLQKSQTDSLKISDSQSNTLKLQNTTGIYEYRTCIECDCNTKPKPICTIRPEGKRFVIRRFSDTCHMLQYNCENNVNFIRTDDYICDADKKYLTTEANEITEEKENGDVLKINKPDFENQTCFQHDCISNNEVICAIRPEDERFIIRWFNDTCQMLQYNCERRVNFSVIDNVVCARDNNSTAKYQSGDEILTTYYDVIADFENFTDLIASVEEPKSEISQENRYELQKETKNVSFPRNIIVSTFDMNENINQTVDRFFASSHLTGIPLQKVNDVETRRMLVKNTGPVNLFRPRAYIPANYTPPEKKNQSKDRPEWTPLVKYCYHKCPTKCPDYYKPVCGARIDTKKQTPYLFYKNHCYMDMAKCHMKWAGYTGARFTDIEEMGFIFCGGYRLMNMMYMFPMIRILQKMGRLQKKGRVHFIMRNLGQFDNRLQG